VSIATEPKYTVPQTAKLLGVSDKKVWNDIGARRISVYRIGKCVRIGESEVLRILESGLCPAREVA
jgi:excisionase family DNA binding protein